jgi:hypothetical protein
MEFLNVLFANFRFNRPIAYLVEVLCHKPEGGGLIPDEVIAFFQFT